jgi:hypothetical protein
MIDLQSSKTALRLCPSGTFENSPAIYRWVHGPTPPKVPQGRQKSVFISLPRRSLAKGDVHPWFKTRFCKIPLRFPKPFQGVPSCSKPFQAFFQKKKIVYCFARPEKFPGSARVGFMLQRFNRFPWPAHRNPKSTAGCRKSTVDSGCELLIWGKNGLQTRFSAACRHPFRLITTEEFGDTDRIQTDTGQKINVSTLDLGCEANACPMEKTATAPP